jgi:hypothetical protein
MRARDRKRLVIALLVVPLIVGLPALWPHRREPGFWLGNLDVLLLFFVLPYLAALWLWLRGAKRRHGP